MSTPSLPHTHQMRLKSHFGFTGLPFRKNVVATAMFDSQSQRELRHGLQLWLDIRGIALVTGPSGAGKSISLRRLVADLPDRRYAVHRIAQIPTTPSGFLRMLCRRLGLTVRMFQSDMFDDIKSTLAAYEEEHGTHPVLILDDAEGMRVPTLDLIRRLSADQLDSTQRVSIVLAGTEQLLHTLRDPALHPLCTRFTYTHALRPFGVEDARNYVRYHLRAAAGPEELFTDDAIRAMFSASQGVPRQLNQLALQSLVEAVVHGLDKVDRQLLTRVIKTHPLYQHRA